MESDLTLRRLREDEEEEFLRAHRATSPEVPSFLHYYEEGMLFRRYLEVLEEQERGINLPSPQHVPSTFRFAFVGTRIVGRATIRHFLNESLKRTGGHIGYVVLTGVSPARLCHQDSSPGAADRAGSMSHESHSGDLR